MSETHNSETSHSDLGDVLLTAKQIKKRIAEVGSQITSDYAGKSPLLVGILKGAFVFLADLARSINLPVEFDFMAVSSYGRSTETSGTVRIIKDLETDIAGRDVILVEDIVDSGLTFDYICRILKARNPKSLAICSLLKRQGVSTSPDYFGFEISDSPPAFVIGYGLDVNEKYRNLSDIYTYNN